MVALYRQPVLTDPLLFGDIFSSDWLYDAVIHKDAVALAPTNLARGAIGYAPLGPTYRTNKDFVLAHGRSCRAVLLSDDCEIETCLDRRRGKGRLLLAAVRPWPADADETRKALEQTTFRKLALEPGEKFEGGIVDLVSLFAVSGKALLNTHGRIVGLDDVARAALEQRWAAYATRRGPLAAADNATKLAHVLDARGDEDRFKVLRDGDARPTAAAQEPAKAVQTVLTQAWRVEGEIMQKIADVHEVEGVGGKEVALLQAELRILGQMALSAADKLTPPTS